MNYCEILKTLGNQTRLDILNLLSKEDSYVEKLACELSLTPATICYHLKKMECVGIVNCSRSQFYIIYSLNKEIFELPLIEFVKTNDNAAGNKIEEKYEKQVLSSFFRFGRLLYIPSQRKKREIVLKEILKSFDNNRKYQETEVNEQIHKFHEDHCTIRREMVAFGMLKRDRDIYWVSK